MTKETTIQTTTAETVILATALTNQRQFATHSSVEMVTVGAEVAAAAVVAVVAVVAEWQS